MKAFLKDKFDSSNLSRDTMIVYLGHKISFSDYIDQYRYTVNILIENIENKNISNFDIIALPTLFLVRHIFELIIKENIMFFRKILFVPLPELKLDTDSHKISILTTYIVPYLKKLEACLNSNKSEKKIVASFIKSIYKMQIHLKPIDNNSYNFRYPFDNNTFLSFAHNMQVDCKNLIDDYYEFIELNYKVRWLTEIIPTDYNI